MTKVVYAAVAVVVAMSGTAAFAGGNSANAKAMTENIKTFNGNTAAALRPGSGSDFEQLPGNTGWGNAGSFATGAGLVGEGFTSGGQVSKSGKRKNDR